MKADGFPQRRCCCTRYRVRVCVVVIRGLRVRWHPALKPRANHDLRAISTVAAHIKQAAKNPIAT